MLSLFDSHLFSWVLLPILIFIARICDVTVGTVRIIAVTRGRKPLASLLGFFEVLIWLLAIGQIMKNLDNVVCYLAYAAGFASGNFIGITIEEKLAIGKMVIRIITQIDPSPLIDSLKAAGYGVTVVDARGTTGKVSLVYTVIQRNALPEVDRLIQEFSPNAFYSIEDVRSVSAGVFPLKRGILKKS